MTPDGASSRLERGATVDIPRGAAHQIANLGQEDLVFIEVQHGDYFGEDDIERLDDDFWSSRLIAPDRRPGALG
jgi:mannose-6-phosphate isomerase